MIEAEWWDYDDAGELADAVASDIEFIVDSALDARGEALVALPGGDLAAPVLARLAKAKLAWKRVTIVPLGDRLVAPTDPASVTGQLAKAFLPIGARVIPLIADAKAPYRKAGLDADERLGGLKWPLDCAWLIAGADADAGLLAVGPDLDSAITAPAHAIGVQPTGSGPGVTLTRATIMAARTVLFAGRGAAGRTALEAAIEKGGPAPLARLLADSELAVDIHWLG